MSQGSVVSVVIPCWNSEMTIGNMLESLIHQTYSWWEAFIIDDQSTDNSQKIVASYSKMDPRIHLVIRTRSPKGAQTCRNIGIEESINAKYLIFFDSDDIINNCCLAQRVNYMEKHPGLDFAVFPACGISKSLEVCNNLLWGFRFREDTLLDMIGRTLPMVGWTNIYRRKAIDTFGLKWDERLLSLQDSDWNIQAILRGARFDYAINDGALIDYYYVVGNNIITNKLTSLDHAKSHLYFISKLVESLDEHQRERYCSELCSYHIWIGRICSKDREMTKEFFRLPWIKESMWTYFRFLLLQLFQFHFSRIIFPIVSKKYIDSCHNWENEKYHFLKDKSRNVSKNVGFDFL